MKFHVNNLQWTRQPKSYVISPDRSEIVTQPHTDLWQRTYYHFRNDNAPVLQMSTQEKFFSFVAGHIPSLEKHLAAVRLDETKENPGQGAFPAAGGAHQPQGFSPEKSQFRVVKGAVRTAAEAAAEGFYDGSSF